MKKLLSIMLVVLLLAGMAVTGTMAYLTSEDSDVNVMTLGNVKIAQHEYERETNADGDYVTKEIEGKTSYVLQPFTQGKALLPIVGDPSTGAAGWDTTTVRMSQVDSYGGMQVFAGKVAQDKFVTVENTGKSDAYVRTIVAIEIGEVDAEKLGTSYHKTWTKNAIETPIEIDGVKYSVTEYVYAGAELDDGSFRHKNGVLPAGETSYPNLSQVYLGSDATNEDMELIDGNKNGMLDILVLSQAVQASGFEATADKSAAQVALDTAFGEANAANVADWFGKTEIKDVGSDADLEDALKDANAEGTVVLNLTSDVTYDVAAWTNEAMGGEKTDKIVLNGNGHTITFNQKDSDWNNIVTNGAKLVINDAKITNTGYNDGPWNRHDLNFACEVEMNNVTSNKALAFKAGAELNNVTINDANTSDTYAIWIQPKGQTVVLNGCTIDMKACTDGRGIKIDNQYIDAADEGKVTLKVSNTTFKTDEKSAILVKTTVGADIILKNVDISGVVADSTNPVWVDEAAAASANLVTVTGGSKILEPNS